MTGSSPFEIQEAPGRGWVRLVVSGELDISTALTFRRRLRALKAADTNVCVDLSELEFIDCAGARALEDVLVETQRGSWRVQLAPDMSYQAQRFFDLITTAGLSTDLQSARGRDPTVATSNGRARASSRLANAAHSAP